SLKQKLAERLRTLASARVGGKFLAERLGHHIQASHVLGDVKRAVLDAGNQKGRRGQIHLAVLPVDRVRKGLSQFFRQHPVSIPCAIGSLQGAGAPRGLRLPLRPFEETPAPRFVRKTSRLKS